MRETYSKDHDKTSKHDDPPNSRLFVAHARQVSEEELRSAFGKYGDLEDVWICKDKNTGERKDIAFIKFYKTSDAAKAMEGLNGKCIDQHTRPIKVTVALSRDQPNPGKNDDMERLLRLFVVVPRSMSEEELTDEFKRFGTLDYVSIVKDRETKESKGFAFVKFTKPSFAATAFEECDRNFKAVFARPKEQDIQRKQERQADAFERSFGSQSSSFGMQSSPSSFRDMGTVSRAGYNGSGMDGRHETTRLTAVVSTQLSDEQVERLFDLLPGFNYCRFVEEPSGYSRAPILRLRRVVVEYNSPNAAAYAQEKLHGFEYPLGKKIVVKSEYDQRGDGFSGNVTGKRDAMGLVAAATAPEITQELATLTKALAEATNMFKMQVGAVGGAIQGARMASNQSTETYDPHLCSARLPPPQPIARLEAKMAERLFIMGLPQLPPQNVLWDVFGRFGDLIEVFVISGKNCGFVNYAKKESADKALQTLHGEEVYQMRMKVTYADPPKQDSRKRIKMDTEN